MSPELDRTLVLMLAQQVSQHSGMNGGGAHKPPALTEELLIVQSAFFRGVASGS